MATIERIVSGTWKQNGYIVFRGTDAIVIDPGGEFARFAECISNNDLRLHAVLNTHAHYDHLGAVAPLVEEFGVPFYLHPADEDLLQRANFYRTLFLGVEPIVTPKLDVALVDSTSLTFGELDVGILHTPGHTPGSVCLEVDGEVFTGDTVMANQLGRTDLPGGDRTLLVSSAERIGRDYAPRTTIHPGHGESAELGDALARAGVVSELRK